MTANELRRLYIDFFVKNYDHKEIRGSSLIPENDPTVLFTTAGMHPLVPFLMGEKHPSGTRLVDVQKCIRTGDIDEVGDDSHLTMFEMLGNWSLGDYFKKEAIEMSFKFLTSSREDGGLGLGLENLAFTCFEGDSDAPKDEESFGYWKELGVSEARVAFLPKKDNWWGPAGQTGPCGPDTEMFYWTGDEDAPENFDTEDSRWVEIWNDVFMQYNKTEDGKFVPLKQQNVDTGMGLERVIVALTGKKSVYETEMFKEALSEIRLLAGYSEPDEVQKVSERIIADHLRAATFIMGDQMGISPSNTDQGYVLRRLIRRAIRHGKKLGIEGDFVRKIAGIYVKQFGDYYTELNENQNFIYEEITKEEEQFNKTLHKGIAMLEKQMERLEEKKSEGVKAFEDNFFFEMFATYGFPIETTIEELEESGWINGEDDRTFVNEKFEHYFKEHQDKSRAGAEKKFAGGLADHSEEVTMYHTATHLLHQALRNVLGDHVGQKGSNLTADRLRFDFSHPEKMTDEQKAEVTNMVNAQIEAALPITMEEMSVDEAKEKGAIGLFESKYGDRVKVYSIGSEEDGTLFSREICGGPHVANTSELGKFKIKKEESSSSGVRRIKGVFVKEG
ncbi:alanine--tRNA ligase [Candidatus Peregrinibacteria bacterium]|jgi:alanyl-tRNA synthetase|nr:alanine--tRNA ligase [Candidatus Peregrinibacteria bacterium]MBT7736888.1 alanine--tRNA ligase [Candidatus Peregrinibacteria bacterium]